MGQSCVLKELHSAAAEEAAFIYFYCQCQCKHRLRRIFSLPGRNAVSAAPVHMRNQRLCKHAQNIQKSAAFHSYKR